MGFLTFIDFGPYSMPRQPLENRIIKILKNRLAGCLNGPEMQLADWKRLLVRHDGWGLGGRCPDAGLNLAGLDLAGVKTWLDLSK